MKQRLIFSIVALLLPLMALADKTAYAVYDNGTLTFKYGEFTPNGEISWDASNTGEDMSTSPAWKFALGENGMWVDDVTKVVFDPSFAEARPKTCFYWFDCFRKLESIEGLQYLNTSEVTNMDCMFEVCEKLTSLDLSTFDTRNVTSMTGMFAGCTNLKVLDLSSFNTARVTNMSVMFAGQSSVPNLIKTILVGEYWTTAGLGSSECTSKGMFDFCPYLEGGFGTKCEGNGDTDKTFARIDAADSPGYLTLKGEPRGYAVYDNGTLTFKYNSAIPMVDTWWNVGNTGNKRGNIPMIGWDARNNQLTKVVFEPTFAEARPLSCSAWFDACTQLEVIEGLEYLNTSEVTSMFCMFEACGKLTSLDLTHFDTSKVTDMGNMFAGCGGLSTLDLSSFNTGKVTNMTYMFAGAVNAPNNLTTIYIGDGWNTDNVTQSDNMFEYASSLVGGNGTTYDSDHLDKTYACVDAPSSPGYFSKKDADNSSNIIFADANVKAICVANWDTDGDGGLSEEEAANVLDLGDSFSFNKDIVSFKELKYFTGLTNIGYGAFRGCSNLTSIVIPDNVTVICSTAFCDCSSLEAIEIPNSVVSIESSAFSGCISLTSVNIPSSITSIILNPFERCTNLASINVEKDNQVYDSRENSNAIIETKSNKLIVGCKNTIIPNGIVSIGIYAFKNHTELTSISLPESITNIYNYAFSGCSGLTSVKIPSSLTSISEGIFYECSNLSSIDIPVTVSSIDANAFKGTAWDNNLPDGMNYVGSVVYNYKGEMLDNTTITLKEGTLGIAGAAFRGCSGLISIEMPSSLTNIGKYAFARCTGLKSISIPNGVTRIGTQAFNGCTLLESIDIPNSVSFIGSEAFKGTIWYENLSDGLIYAGLVAYGYKGSMQESELTLKEGTAGVAGRAFQGVNGLKTVTIPQSVASIGEYAFSDCTNLSSVFVKWSEPLDVDDIFFDGSRETLWTGATLHVPKGYKDVYQKADYWKNFEVIVDDVEIIPASPTIVFADANVKALCVANWDTNGDGELSEAEAAVVTDLGQVFRGDTQITSFDELHYFTGLQTITSSEFRDCSSLTSIAIPSSVTLIEANAFEGCNDLASVHITDMAAWCEICFESNPLWYAKHLFLNGTEIKDLVIPDGVTSISGWSFSYWSSLTSVTIPKSVTSIGKNAFGDCDGLTTVSIDNSVLVFEENAFHNCNNLTSLHITDVASWCESQVSPFSNPLAYAHSLFINDNEVIDLEIPQGVTEIYEGVFEGCSNMASVTIPSSVTNIKMGAFANCNKLLDIYCLPETPPVIIDDPWFLRKTATLHVPNVSLEAYKSTDYWKEFKFIVGLDDVITESDRIYSDGQSIYQGYYAKLEIKLANENTFTAYQFDLVLPEGIAIATDDNGKYLVAKSDRYSDDSQQIRVEKHDDNIYRIMSVSMQNGVINDNGGVILTLTLKTDSEVAPGSYDAEIRDIVLTEPDETNVKTKYVTFPIEVRELLKGDANGDGEIDVTDIVTMINCILGQPSANFILAAADMNNDGEIDIFDVIKAINLVMKQNTAARNKVRAIGDAEEQAVVKATADGIMLGVNNAERFTAFQFDVEMAEGVELKDAKLIATAGSHKLYYIKNGQNTYKVMGVSMDNSTLAANDLVELKFSKGGDVQISNVVFVTPQENKVLFVCGNTVVTGIGSIATDLQEEVLDLSGRKLDIDRSHLPKGIYIINNKKVVIK